ncbi:MAG: D-glycero-beta-D-manno-heptose-7-phosphate kinase [Chthonomonadaceae bacterium]|nr:D-glycero-beta-D-manno-heptose-7-phosphate kinase [Chthonomonadaceae bacterium]
MTHLEMVRSLPGLRIAVLGDLMMDEYVWGDAKRVSPESPVLVVTVDRDTSVPGGAANVASNVISLGGKAHVFGVVGDDAKGMELIEALARQGAGTDGVVTTTDRPTTSKARVIAQNQQVLRIDRESSRSLPLDVADRLAGHFRDGLGRWDAILISDYAKGVVCPEIVPAVIQGAKKSGIPIVANGKPANAACFLGADVLSFNLSEALAASGDPRFETDDIRDAGADLRRRLDVGTLVVTRGRQGVMAWTESSIESVPARQVEVFDVAGAGDTVIATLCLSIVAGASLAGALELANIAASVVVGKVGVAPVTTHDLERALASTSPN